MARRRRSRTPPNRDKCKRNPTEDGRSGNQGDGNSYKLPQPNSSKRMTQKYLQLLTSSNAKANYSATINSGINDKIGNNRSIQTPVIMLVVLVYLQLELKSCEVRKRK
ncbi:hypothetical protein DVH24_042785 [Malus domestica]|uniref:Uncharacterized protein n=1 Tax=Malus domestica TaxID=3750 RepID=A0A498HWK5_MALDO|nr:hypothetical protein DVH24_042785 [Malus domestica]